MGAAVFQTRRLESPRHVDADAAAYQKAMIHSVSKQITERHDPPPRVSCLLLVLLHTSSTTGVGDLLTSPPTADAHASSTGPAWRKHKV